MRSRWPRHAPSRKPKLRRLNFRPPKPLKHRNLPPPKPPSSNDWDDPTYSLTWEPKRAELFKSGKMGNTSGRWTYHGKNEKGEKVTLQGDYLTVWQKQADGSWKVIYDGGTPDPATK